MSIAAGPEPQDWAQTGLHLSFFGLLSSVKQAGIDESMITADLKGIPLSDTFFRYVWKSPAILQTLTGLFCHATNCLESTEARFPLSIGRHE
jgi:hypothetical protein